MLSIDPECHHFPCCGAFQHMEAKEGGATSEFHPEINVVASVLREPMFGQCVEAFIAARKQTDVHIYKRERFQGSESWNCGNGFVLQEAAWSVLSNTEFAKWIKNIT